ncbi:MAG TPA: hypothetical protein VF094_00910 [Gaiellaceae bacterium]
MSEAGALSGAQKYVAPEFRGLTQDEARLRDLRRKLDDDGVVELRDFLTPEGHALLRDQILELERKATSSFDEGNRKYAVKGDQLAPTVVGELARSSFILDLVNRVLGRFDDAPAWSPEPVGPDEIVAGINIMRGPGDVTAYHFDGTLMNLIFPVTIPKLEGPHRGQLVIYPNVRSFRRTFWDRKVVPAIGRSARLRRLWKRREVDYQERGLYLFYGYRSLHGVESPDEPGLRCITNMVIAPRFK